MIVPLLWKWLEIKRAKGKTVAGSAWVINFPFEGFLTFSTRKREKSVRRFSDFNCHFSLCVTVWKSCLSFFLLFHNNCRNRKKRFINSYFVSSSMRRKLKVLCWAVQFFVFDFFLASSMSLSESFHLHSQLSNLWKLPHSTRVLMRKLKSFNQFLSTNFLLELRVLLLLSVLFGSSFHSLWFCLCLFVISTEEETWIKAYSEARRLLCHRQRDWHNERAI